MKKVLLPLAAAAVVALLLIFPDNSMQYVRASLDMCFTMIVPTLFPFFVCSGILIYSGFCEMITRVFRFCMKPLFGVSPAGASAFVLGIISGYPLGAVTAGQLYESGFITKTEAERLCAFCSNSGPLFVIGSVGAAMYGSVRLGAMLYAAHVLSSLTVGVMFRFYKRSAYTAPPAVLSVPERNVGEIFGIALNNAVSSMLTVCGAVVFFGAAGNLMLDLLPIKGALYALAAGCVEFVNGSVKVSMLDADIAQRLVMTAFIVGFAGLSVHAQVVAVIAKHGFSLAPYFIGKLIHGLIAALYTYICLKLFPAAETVFAPSMSKGCCGSSAALITAAAAAVCAGIACRLICDRSIITR